METVVQLLKDLTALPGIPGREEAVARYLMEYTDLQTVDRKVDLNGNVWLHGDGPKKPPVVFCAHIDEVGWKVKRIDEDGRLAVIGHERTDLRTLASEVVEIWTDNGPVNAFVYLGQQTQMPKNYDNMVPETLRLDLGTTDRTSTEALGVRVGDPVIYDRRFFELGGGVYCAKAFDDRCGVTACLRGMQISEGKRAQRPVFLGTVQEEIGGHGAHAVDFEEKPGALIVLDICGGEVYNLPVADRRPMLGKGPILHDGPCASQALLRRFEELAKREGIPYQRYAVIGRGADMSILQHKSGGLPTLGMIIPMAFYHGPRGFVHGQDVLNAGRLLSAALCDEELLDHTGKW